MILGITGGPRTGKTELAKRLSKRFSLRVFHTDEVRGVGWARQPYQIISLATGADIIEGVQVARAIRKGLVVDSPLIVLARPLAELTPGQSNMTSGLATILRSLSIRIEEFVAPADAEAYIVEYMIGANP